MNSSYKSQLLRNLCDQQLATATREQLIAVADRAETLISELNANAEMGFARISQTLIGCPDRIDSTISNEQLSEQILQHDLRLLAEDFTDAANLNSDDVIEPVYTVKTLGTHLQVSSKTISRWRNNGLVSRKIIIDGRKRVAFLASTVDRFVTQNRHRVERGERFSQLSKSEKMDILDQARKLAAAGACPSEVAKRLADHFSRSIETIRYTLKRHDKKNPAVAIFPRARGKLSEDSKRSIFQRYRQGTSISMLARQFNRTSSTVHRIINEMRATQIFELPMDFMPNAEFSYRNAEKRIMAPIPEPETTTRRTKAPKGLPSYLTSLYEVTLLTREQEQHLFRKYNYTKFRADKLRQQLNVDKPTCTEMDEIESWYDQAVQLKQMIVQCNLRLVVSIAKRHMKATDDFFTLVSDGNMSLIRAAEKFNYALGNKFSTYASWAIMKNFARTIPNEFKHRDRFRTSLDEMFAFQSDGKTNRRKLECDDLLRKSEVTEMLRNLDDREQQIIIRRFGLDPQREPQTLQQVGVEMGVTKERVRQIQAKALKKLRLNADERHLELIEDD